MPILIWPLLQQAHKNGNLQPKLLNTVLRIMMNLILWRNTYRPAKQSPHVGSRPSPSPSHTDQKSNKSVLINRYFISIINLLQPSKTANERRPSQADLPTVQTYVCMSSLKMGVQPVANLRRDLLAQFMDEFSSSSFSRISLLKWQLP